MLHGIDAIAELALGRQTLERHEEAVERELRHHCLCPQSVLLHQHCKISPLGLFVSCQQQCERCLSHMGGGKEKANLWC